MRSTGKVEIVEGVEYELMPSDAAGMPTGEDVHIDYEDHRIWFNRSISGWTLRDGLMRAAAQIALYHRMIPVVEVLDD